MEINHMNAETRLDLWKEPHPLPLFTVPGNDEVAALQEKIASQSKDDGKPRARATNWDIIEACKELIFDVVDGKPVFHAVMFALDSDHFELTVLHLFDIIDLDSADEIVATLAAAKALDVPVYPNTPALASQLASYHRELLLHGFTAPGEDGKRVRLRLTKGPHIAHGVRFLDQLQTGHLHTPAEIILIRDEVREELGRRKEAGRILSAIRNAIDELQSCLVATKRNENRIQRCLTKNPILFGTEYRKLIPKHRLGSDYVMDYALQRVTGLVDYVEIESSNLKLFTKGGMPSKELVHAEQQVLDWLSWTEKNSPYAREKLPTIQRPIGYVIIGRSVSMSSEDRSRLVQRNLVFRGTFEILTYDDLLERARNLLQLLQGNPGK
jgi:hypothetical protein